MTERGSWMAVGDSEGTSRTSQSQRSYEHPRDERHSHSGAMDNPETVLLREGPRWNRESALENIRCLT